MIKADLKKPYVMAHAGGMAHGRENSIEAVQNSAQFKPDIFELDLRRSSDGVLFCYHGFPGFPFYVFAYFLRFMKFDDIQQIVKVDTLKNILDVVADEPIIFLDIKQRNISAKEIDVICKNYKFEFWLAPFYCGYLKRLKKELGNAYKYVFNWSPFNFRRAFEKVKKNNLDAMKVFPWHCTDKNIAELKKSGIVYAIQPLFKKTKKFKRLVSRYGSLWLCVDDLKKVHR